MVAMETYDVPWLQRHLKLFWYTQWLYIQETAVFKIVWLSKFDDPHQKPFASSMHWLLLLLPFLFSLCTANTLSLHEYRPFIQFIYSVAGQYFAPFSSFQPATWRSKWNYVWEEPHSKSLYKKVSMRTLQLARLAPFHVLPKLQLVMTCNKLQFLIAYSINWVSKIGAGKAWEEDSSV